MQGERNTIVKYHFPKAIGEGQGFRSATMGFTPPFGQVEAGIARLRINSRSLKFFLSALHA